MFLRPETALIRRVWSAGGGLLSEGVELEPMAGGGFVCPEDPAVAGTAVDGGGAPAGFEASVGEDHQAVDVGVETGQEGG